MPVIYKFSISIVYNEDNSSIESEKLIIPVASKEDYAGYYASEHIKDNAVKNYRNLKKFIQDDALKSNQLTGIYDSYEKNKVHFL